jgi:hypothetical protein
MCAITFVQNRVIKRYLPESGKVALLDESSPREAHTTELFRCSRRRPMTRLVQE